MDSFFDTSVIIHYANFTEQTENKLIRKCFEYINNKKGKFIISLYVQKELEGVIEKRALMYKLILDSITKGVFIESKYLSKDDLSYAKKQYELLRDNKNAQEILFNDLDHFKNKIYWFEKRILDESTLSETEIDISLVKIIREFIIDYSDCMVLASAIQIQQNKEQFFFVTADGHFDSGGYNFVEEDIRLEKYKKPKLKNLLFED